MIPLHFKTAIIQREQKFGKYGLFCLCLANTGAEPKSFADVWDSLGTAVLKGVPAAKKQSF